MRMSLRMWFWLLTCWAGSPPMRLSYAPTETRRPVSLQRATTFFAASRSKVS